MFVNKTSHYIVSWYQQLDGTSEGFQLFRNRLEQIRNKHKGKIHRSVHAPGDFNFKDIDCPDRLNESGEALCQSEGKYLD